MKTRKLFWKAALSVIAGLAVAVIIVYVAYLNHRKYEKLVVSQAQQQLLMLAKTTAQRIEEFIDEHVETLKTLSLNPAVQEAIHKRIMHKAPESEYCPVQTLYEIHANATDALTTLDADGIMLHRHPYIENRPGMDHKDKPGVGYVVREHKPYVSEPFYNNLGNLAVSIAEPVFCGGEFVGMVRWMVQTDTIYTRFMQSLQTGTQSCKWIVDARGILLGHEHEDRTGQHFVNDDREKMPDYDWSTLENILAESIQGREGTGIFLHPELGKRVVAYAPVHVGNQLWSVGICIAYSEVARPIAEHARNTFAISGVIILLFAGGGITLFRTQKRKAELKVETKHLRQIAKSAEALRQSEEKLAGIISSVTDHMCMMDEHHTIFWANDVAKGLFGPDLVGKKCYQMYHGYDTPCEPCVVNKCFEDGKIHECETEVTGADGKQVVFWCTASVAAHDADGRPKMVVEICRDITKRKMVEEEREQLISDLQKALSEIKALSGMLPICASCKKIRDDKGYWNQIEAYISTHSEVEFSHGICPECEKKLYGEWLDENE
ncbi:MAG: PAS domain S-box protein [Deltaproteobacteria bacterium]|nr:PAS domain S-box protein [Deltaproteobacteria bacterium]